MPCLVPQHRQSANIIPFVSSGSGVANGYHGLEDWPPSHLLEKERGKEEGVTEKPQAGVVASSIYTPCAECWIALGDYGFSPPHLMAMPQPGGIHCPV